MSETAIRVEGISKRYRIGKREPYLALRDVMANALRSPLKAFSKNGAGRSATEHIWSLKDVSFEIQQGEAVGLIGSNGAGKTTLLKILARVTRPTVGRAEVHGRIGSLLEVGTGFHPELTGRENVFLNGAILGMGRAEIRRKFDEIVDFSGVEQFIDTPLKHYSSGMQMRLAFSVAAHLQPEILLVDEVLAVGDLEFQKKCMGKMEEVSRHGRTVIFVSHNMGAIKTLCSRAILLEGGRALRDGHSADVVNEYVARATTSSSGNDCFADCPRTGNGRLRVLGFQLESPQGEPLTHASSGQDVVFAFRFANSSLRAGEPISLGFSINTDTEFPLALHYSSHCAADLRNLPEQGLIRCLVRSLPLAPGNYLLGVRVEAAGDDADWPKILVPFSVLAGDFYQIGAPHMENWAPILLRGEWNVASAVEVVR